MNENQCNEVSWMIHWPIQPILDTPSISTKGFVRLSLGWLVGWLVGWQSWVTEANLAEGIDKTITKSLNIVVVVVVVNII